MSSPRRRNLFKHCLSNECKLAFSSTSIFLRSCVELRGNVFLAPQESLEQHPSKWQILPTLASKCCYSFSSTRISHLFARCRDIVWDLSHGFLLALGSIRLQIVLCAQILHWFRNITLVPRTRRYFCWRLKYVQRGCITIILWHVGLDCLTSVTPLRLVSIWQIACCIETTTI